jgi:transposase-like protein
MPKGYPSLTHEQKQTIANRIKEKGERVADLAREYGVPPKSIYHYLRRASEHSGSLLELARVKRERDALLQIVGQMIVDHRLGKKIQHRHGS